MADSKDFAAAVDSNAKRSPRRIVFLTRRTSAQVKAETEDQVQTFPEVLFRAAVAVMTLAVVLVWIALMFDAPLEGLADPSAHAESGESAMVLPGIAGDVALLSTSSCGRARSGTGGDGPHRYSVLQSQHRSGGTVSEAPAEAAAYFLCRCDRAMGVPRCLQGLRGSSADADHGGSDAAGVAKFSAIAFGLSAISAARPLSYWVMTWFLFELVVLTAIGTFFRGPGWSWVWPWQG